MTEDTQHAELIQRIANGDEKAMSDLYIEFESRIYAFALKKLNDSHAAADIVHEVMIAVWKGASAYQGRSKVKSWLFGIAHNKIVDFIRSAKKHESEELDEEPMGDDVEAGIELVQAAENRDFLKYCLEKLSDLQRQVVHLAFFEDFSYGEISEVVGTPEGTIKTRMFHAKQLLKKCLQGRLGTVN